MDRKLPVPSREIVRNHLPKSIPHPNDTYFLSACVCSFKITRMLTSHELQSKLLKGGYRGDYRGEYYKGSPGGC